MRTLFVHRTRTQVSLLKPAHMRAVLCFKVYSALVIFITLCTFCSGCHSNDWLICIKMIHSHSQESDNQWIICASATAQPQIHTLEVITPASCINTLTFHTCGCKTRRPAPAEWHNNSMHSSAHECGKTRIPAHIEWYNDPMHSPAHCAVVKHRVIGRDRRGVFCSPLLGISIFSNDVSNFGEKSKSLDEIKCWHGFWWCSPAYVGAVDTDPIPIACRTIHTHILWKHIAFDFTGWVMFYESMMIWQRLNINAWCRNLLTLCTFRCKSSLNDVVTRVQREIFVMTRCMWIIVSSFQHLLSQRSLLHGHTHTIVTADRTGVMENVNHHIATWHVQNHYRTDCWRGTCVPLVSNNPEAGSASRSKKCMRSTTPG